MTPHHQFDAANLPEYEMTRKRKDVAYVNLPCGYDIETTSIEAQGDKYAFMYVWMVGIGHDAPVYYGRTFAELVDFCDRLADAFELDEENNLVIYVHNLGYEFQFMRHYFEWANVFAVGERKPIRATTTGGIEFRDSLILSGFSLANTAKNLTSHNVAKLEGDLDYSLVRHHKTPLTDDELAYCHNDIAIITAYISEQMAIYGDIHKIPMTNTGRVRQYVREECYHVPGKTRRQSRGKFTRYRKIMNDLTVDEPTYRQLKRAFMGGFTHASAYKSGRVIDGVDSIDLSSSYPAVMVAEQFPMSRARPLHASSIAELKKLAERHCMVFDLKLSGVANRLGYESYISESRCDTLANPVIDNGRVYAADELTTTITDVDFQIIEAVYSWDEIEVKNITGFVKGYLPKPIVKSILDLYRKKTELKGVAGYETEYLLSKGMLNSIYGMSVTDILQDNHEYENGWMKGEVDVKAEIEKYNESMNRFLYYPWGVWVTAYARRNVWSAILNAGDDYIYCDTDSVKMTNFEKHAGYVERYNKRIQRQLSDAVKALRLNVGDLAPKNKHGERKPLGIWEHEGHYSEFKTLGAKRYLYREGDSFHLVVAGLSKQNGMNYIRRHCNDDAAKIFAMFNDELFIPEDETGKMTHTYIDDAHVIDVQDYRGDKATVEPLSGLHLEPCEFTLSISRQYQTFIKMLANGYKFTGVKHQ